MSSPSEKFKPHCAYCGVVEGFIHLPDCALARSPGGLPARKPPLRIVTTVPPEVEQYAPEIARFVEAMVYKLGVKAHKGKWEGMPINKALELLRGEEKELTEAVERGNMVEVLLESADVANFALIISAIAMEKK
jgi:hypothetical protein